MADNNREALAWTKVQQPGPRPRYQHATAYRRRESKRAAFRKRLALGSDGCWLWAGDVLTGPNGQIYPVFNHRRETTPDNTTRAAFNWMMREWFPEVELKSHARTTTTCRDRLCLNPFHRVMFLAHNQAGLPRMDHDLVRTIYAARGTMTQPQAAEKFGVHHTTVARIWSGKRWSSLTGHNPATHKTNRLTALKALRIYAARSQGGTMESIAQQFGVSRNTVRSVWYGSTWAHVTGAEQREPETRLLSDATRRLILEGEGKKSAYTLAKELGVAKSTVVRTWKRARLSQEQATC